APRSPNLLFGRRLPELDLVALGIGDPPELPVLRLVNLDEDVASLFSQGLEQGAEVGDSVIHHEGGRARREGVALGGDNGPGCRSTDGLALPVGPAKRSAPPALHVDTEVSLVPGPHRLRILRLEEDAANTRNAFHVDLDSCWASPMRMPSGPRM